MTDVFEHLGNDIRRWKSMAEALAYNANVLTQHRHQHQEDRNPYQQRLEISSVDMDFASLVLWGYALECLLKCLRLKRGHPLVKNGKYIWVKNHDLVQMAQEVSFVLTDSQRRILESLSAIAKWSGRYPIDTTPKGTFLSHYWEDPKDDGDLEILVESLRLEIGS
jgi:hypothetical protein